MNKSQDNKNNIYSHLETHSQTHARERFKYVTATYVLSSLEMLLA